MIRKCFVSPTPWTDAPHKLSGLDLLAYIEFITKVGVVIHEIKNAAYRTGYL